MLSYGLNALRSPYFSLQTKWANTLKLANNGPVTDYGLVLKLTFQNPHFKLNQATSLRQKHADGLTHQHGDLQQAEQDDQWDGQTDRYHNVPCALSSSSEVHAHTPAGKG